MPPSTKRTEQQKRRSDRSGDEQGVGRAQDVHQLIDGRPLYHRLGQDGICIDNGLISLHLDKNEDAKCDKGLRSTVWRW